MAMTEQTFRYRGPFNWPRVVAGTAQFFRDRKYEFYDVVHKYKGNELEGRWRAELRIDAYHKYVFVIDYKITDIVEEGENIRGKMRLVFSTDYEKHYAEKGPLTVDEQAIFGKDSWLHKVYIKATQRDREEGIEDRALELAQAYLAWLKMECNIEAK